ncbi:dynein regulatory complex subunit 2-like [Galleria mellonella]|uniref:Dynein regulatory complex subunit 2 n=1 Tax=Galleria mellonella TaxID=7137 RepID=A0A6J1X6N8_GALME|nr:dynein regulatory complex subunit 2-like [Galleria mellonella]
MALTKEEKKAKKEAKRLEKLKAEEEQRKKLKREELEREMAAQALKRGELDKTWRELMLKIKEPVFRQDIEVMWHTFERVYDKKDHLINHTMKLMDVADDQFQRTVASFCDTIDTMINKFLFDLEEMSKDNNRRTSELLKHGADDAAQIMSDHNTAETHLQLLLYHGHTTADSLAWTTRGENLVKEDEERMKYVNDRENLRSFLENNYSGLWDEYKGVLKAYVVNTADNQKQVRKLRRKENLMADIIASQSKKIASSDGILKRLRTELAAYESGTKQAVFRDRRNRHRAACFRLKQCLINGCTTDLKQLATLVKASDSAVEWLELAVKKGEKILRMAALCRKFETRREKVLPFGSAMPYSSTQAKSNVRRQQSDDSLVVNAISTTCGLTRLWQRIAKAELTKRALIREKIFLQHENALIMKKIQDFKERKIGPVTHVCSCSNAGPAKSIVRPTAIEGVLEVNKYIKS